MASEVNAGYRAAKGGFAMEYEVIDRFNNWIEDPYAQYWLDCILKSRHIEDLEKIVSVKAEKAITGRKADVMVTIEIRQRKHNDTEAIQVKLVSGSSGYNQIDKRWVDQYKELWDLPEDLCIMLKRFCGELPPNIEGTRDAGRMYLNEFPVEDQEKLTQFFNDNKGMIVNDIFIGRTDQAARWIIVMQPSERRTVILPINRAISYLTNGQFEITSQGGFHCGHVAMQRKGGDNGKPTANMMQFKINPLKLFNLDPGFRLEQGVKEDAQAEEK